MARQQPVDDNEVLIRPFLLPRAIIDQHTLIAQKYAGWFFGFGYQYLQSGTGPQAVTKTGPWKEPVVVRDECEFCTRMSDEDVIRRVNGFQHQIDIEVLRAYDDRYTSWLVQRVDEVPETVEITVTEKLVVSKGVTSSAKNRRAFIERYVDPLVLREKTGMTALPLVRLPLRLKRKLCIEWNHLYRDFLKENPNVEYDWEKREFVIRLPALKELECCGGEQRYDGHANRIEYHRADCEAAGKASPTGFVVEDFDLWNDG